MTRGGAARLVGVLLGVAFGIAGFRNGRARPAVDGVSALATPPQAAGETGSASPQTGPTRSAIFGPAVTSPGTPGERPPAGPRGGGFTPDEVFSRASPAVV